MKIKLTGLLLFFMTIWKLPAQQNWVGFPCYNQKWEINRMFIDSVHNEIILNSNFGYKTCNITYKGVFAYNPNGFHDLDFGLNKFNPNPATGGFKTLGCIPYGGKTLFGGFFSSVGSNTLQAEAIAMWNGNAWDTFPKKCFRYDPGLTGKGAVVWGFTKFNNRLWIYGAFDSIAGQSAKNICAFDGNTFYPSFLPVSDNDGVTKMIVYKNKLIAGGPFYDLPSWSIARLAMYDGVSWASVGTGVRGSIAGVYDMAIYNDTLFIAGEWQKAAGNVGNHIMKWDGTQLTDAGFGNFCGWGGIWSMAVYKNRLYAFGRFMCAANQKAFGVAYYENGKWTVPQDSIQGNGIQNAVVYNDAIYVSGGFKSINGDTAISYFASLRCPDFDAATGCLSGLKDYYKNRLNLKVFPNPANNKIIIEADNSLKIEKLTISSALGQPVLTLTKPGSKLELDISFLPAGIYFLKAENRQGQSVFKVVKE